MNVEKIFSLPAAKLKNALRTELNKLGYDEGSLHNKKDFLYAEGNAPYMLVAHLDTVHRNAPSIICYSKDGEYMMSPQGIGGDDRCGVYIILELLNKLLFKPYVVFTMGEEIGGIGADAFVQYIADAVPNLKYIVEYDRKGSDDCVFYQCDNSEFTKFVEKFGFKTAYGSFSDISIIAPELGVAAVNLSSGYYNPHTEHEYVSFKDMQKIIDRSVQMFAADCEQFIYVKRAENHYNGGYTYGYIDTVVTFLPENSVYVYDVYGTGKRMNFKGEIAIDELGQYYKLSTIYDDYMKIKTVELINPNFIPKFDENNSENILVFSYSKI